MAFYSEDDDQTQAAGNGGAAVSKPGSGLVGGGNQTQGGAGAAPSEKAQGSTPGNASPFVGINEYLKTNKQQSGKLGGQVGGFVGGKIDNANQKLAGAEQDFGNQVDQSTVKLDQNLVNQIKADPTRLTQDPNKVNQVKAMAKGYAGPSDFQTNQAFQGVKGDLDKANTAVGNLANSQGQKQLLTEQQLETRGGKLNRGAATLDQALLQASPEARAALKPTEEKGAQLKSNIDTTIANAMNKVAGAQKQSAETNQAMKDLYNQQYAEQQAQLQKRAADTNAAVKQRMSDVRARAFGGATDEDLGFLGLSRGDYDSLMNDFKQYAPQEGLTGAANSFGSFLRSTGDANANVQNVASAEDYARAQALRELSGFGGEYLNNPAQSGNYARDLVDFDLAGARNFINPLKAKAEQLRLAAQQSGGGSGIAEGVNNAMGGGILAPVTNTAGNVVSGAKKVFSDKNLKTDIKHFDASKFMEAVSPKKGSRK